MKNARLDEAQAGIKIAWRNNNNLIYADDPYGRKQIGIKSFLMMVKEESDWLKTQHSENEDHGIPVPSLHGK